MKSRDGKSQRREEKRREEERISKREEKRRRKKIKKRKSPKKEDPGARKGRKVAKHCVFPMICGSGGTKSRLAKAAGAEPAGQMRDKKLHAVVARSTFPSQHVQNTPLSDHFWKLRCRKSARCCGGKHISKSKCTKHTMFGPLLEVEMSKKCALLWRDAKPKVKKLQGSEQFWTFRCRFAWQAQGIVHLVKIEVLCQFQKRWQAWDICRGSGKMHFAWQAQYTRHVHQSC